MADSNQLKRIDPIDFGNDDPFAELTKIMGFDPRQPAQPAESPRAAAPRVEAPRLETPRVETPRAEAPRPLPPVEAPAPVAAVRVEPVEPDLSLSDDFAMDLEQELLAGFEPAPVEAPVARAPYREEPRFVEPAPLPEASEPEDLDIGHEFAAALDDMTFEDELPAVEPVAAFEPADRYATEAAVAADLEPFDRAHDGLLDDLEFALADEDLVAPEQEPLTPAAYDNYPAATVAEDPIQEEIDLDFDLAMADVDLEFGNELALDEATAAPARTETFAPEAERWTPPYDPSEDLDRVIGELDAAAHAPAIQHVDFDAAPAYGETVHAGHDDVDAEAHGGFQPTEHELSFEDELKALLGTPPVQPAVLTAHYDEPAAEEAWYDEAPAAAPLAYDESPAPARSAYAAAIAHDAAPAMDLEIADAFDDSAFDTAFERELSAVSPQATVGRAMAPDVDTVEVPGGAVPFTHDLDIPEIAREDAVPAASAYDDYEPDFSELFSDAQLAEAPAAPVRTAPAARVIDPYEVALATTAAATAAIAGTARRPVAPEWDDAAFAPALAAARPQPAPAGPRQVLPQPPEFDQYEDELDGPLDFSDVEPFEDEPAPRRRGLLIAAVVGGVALLGAVGAFALSFGGETGSDVPALVRADSDPVKVRPEEPGGDTAPNADSKVFQTITGDDGADAPAQERLNSSSEEPIDLAARSVDPVAVAPDATAKSEERVAADEEASADSMEVAAVAPRRVKTMVVKPDGTLVPREDGPTDPAPSALAPAVTETAPAEPMMQLPGVDPVAVAPEPELDTAATDTTPPTVPLAPARPADQPVEVVGEVAPETVAVVAPAGGWAVQIASQPSEAAAQSTYEDLARRYASVIGGKPASIVKAEIAGKGTFWRVRIGASTRNEAIGLCEQYKSAGGNCFVSK